MMTQTRGWKLWLATLPITWALTGCGGDKPAPAPSGGGSGGGTPPAETSSGDTTPEKATTGEPTAAAAVTGWGTIKGTVAYDGDAPAPQFIHKAGDANVKDAATCAKNDMVNEEWVVNPENKGIRWVLVYVDKPAAIHDDLKTASGEVELGQEFCVFKPHMLAYRAGQKLTVTSSDPVGHNTNMQPLRGDGINPLLPAAPEGEKSKLEAPEWKAQNRPFEVKCNVHGWMKAWVMILDHPYFAVTDENGNFEIKNVPAGKVKVVSWQESVGWGEGDRGGKEIDVPADGVAELNLKFKAK